MYLVTAQQEDMIRKPVGAETISCPNIWQSEFLIYGRVKKYVIMYQIVGYFGCTKFLIYPKLCTLVSGII